MSISNSYDIRVCDNIAEGFSAGKLPETANGNRGGNNSVSEPRRTHEKGACGVCSWHDAVSSAVIEIILQRDGEPVQ